MTAQQPLHVKVDKGSGCCGGCMGLIVVVAVVGLVAGFVADYWPMLLVIVIVAVVIGVVVWQAREHDEAADPAVDVGTGQAIEAGGAGVGCAECGAPVASTFCPACGCDQRGRCRRCGHALTSAYCPHCGTAAGA